MNNKIKSISTFYKKYVQTSIICISELKFIKDQKLQKYIHQYENLKKKDCILSLPSILKNPEQKISNFINNTKKNSIISESFQNLNKIMEENYCIQNLFLQNYGNYLPSACFNNYKDIFPYNNLKFTTKGNKNLQISTDIMNSLNSSTGEMISKVIIEQKDELTIEEIENFYKKELEKQEKTYKMTEEITQGNIKLLEKEIEECFNEILCDLSIEKNKFENIMNIYEEIDILNAEDIRKKIEQKILYLK